MRRIAGKHRPLAATALTILTVLILATTAAGMASAENHDQDQVINVPGDDPEMTAAIAEARATLPEFWKALASPGLDMVNFALKVMIVDDGQVEHFWLSRISRTGSTITGTIDNEPAYVKNVRIGEIYSFTDKDISDWMFMRNGKIVGNHTLRPLLKRMPKDQADYYRSLLEKP